MRLASAPESCFSHCSLQLRVTSRVQTMSFRFARLRILPIPLFLHWAQSPAPSSPLFLSSARSRCTRICAPTRLFLDSRRSRYRTFAILQFFVTTLCFMQAADVYGKNYILFTKHNFFKPCRSDPKLRFFQIYSQEIS